MVVISQHQPPIGESVLRRLRWHEITTLCCVKNMQENPYEASKADSDVPSQPAPPNTFDQELFEIRREAGNAILMGILGLWIWVVASGRNHVWTEDSSLDSAAREGAGIREKGATRNHAWLHRLRDVRRRFPFRRMRRDGCRCFRRVRSP